jgi:MerR family transcriptional regulator, light-induced transcriptional regulator
MNSHHHAVHASTANVARALGVSVSTVKRWVDDGILPAQKTAGGHRKLLIADVLELARRSNLPHADLSLLVGSGRKARQATTVNLAGQLHRSLREGDGEKTRVLILGSYHDGMSVAEIADEAIAPAMAAVGHEWETGKIDVMEEHRASQLCAGVLYELKAKLEERAGNNRPRAVGAAPEADYSVLPTLLAQMTLLDAGWEAVNLGPNTPFQSLARALVKLRPRLVWLSISHLGAEDAFVSGYRGFYRHAETAQIPVAIGGSGLKDLVRTRIPYTTYGDRLGHLAAFARTLHPRPTRPTRGRPRLRN